MKENETRYADSMYIFTVETWKQITRSYNQIIAEIMINDSLVKGENVGSI